MRERLVGVKILFLLENKCLQKFGVGYNRIHNQQHNYGYRTGHQKEF